MRIRQTSLLLPALALSACSQIVVGSGDPVTEDIAVEAFTEVELVGSAIVIITAGEIHEVEVEAQRNVIDILTTRMSGDRLILGETSGTTYSTSEPVIFRVRMPELEELEVSGSGTITVDDAPGDRLAVRLSGSGDIHVSGSFDDLRVDLDGSGTVSASGSSDDLRVDVDGSGSFDGVELSTDDADVGVSGSGSALVNVSRRLEADVSGSGSVEYVGEPENLDASVSGSGSIERR
jgi:hypothetical protein